MAQEWYSAGSVQQRIADIDELLADPDVKALLASRGGKSANQLLRFLPYQDILAKRKPIIGFSDGCVLLNAITANTGLLTFYGPNNVDNLPESVHWDLKLIRGESMPVFGSSAPDQWRTLVPGQVEGQLFGGNLSTFVLGCVGTETMAAMRDVIFFWESGSNSPQVIDQYLACLANCGFLTRVKAMIVGEALYTERPEKDRPVNEIITEYARQFGFPAVRIKTFGHASLENPCIPIGAQVQLDTETTSVALSHPVVAFSANTNT